MGIHGPLTDAQREALGRVARAQRHLLRLINDVLNLSRIEAGHVEYRVEDVRLTELVDAVMPMVEPQLKAKGLRCAAHVPPELVARADREKLQQILLNLLSNAAKFTPAGGGVTIVGAADAGRARLSVRDTGIGIPPDDLGRIFAPFVQVDTSHTRRAEGTGLGLAISRDLARGMDGDLTAESVVGEGTTFTLTLPRSG
jgi:signal transduction histidine kinase